MKNILYCLTACILLVSCESQQHAPLKVIPEMGDKTAFYGRIGTADFEAVDQQNDWVKVANNGTSVSHDDPVTGRSMMDFNVPSRTLERKTGDSTGTSIEVLTFHFPGYPVSDYSDAELFIKKIMPGPKKLAYNPDYMYPRKDGNYLDGFAFRCAKPYKDEKGVIHLKWYGSFWGPQGDKEFFRITQQKETEVPNFTPDIRRGFMVRADFRLKMYDHYGNYVFDVEMTADSDVIWDNRYFTRR